MHKKMKEAMGTQSEREGAAGWDLGMGGLFRLLLPYRGWCEQ